MQLKKLPIGIQTFSEIIENNYVYVDKTDIAYNLIDNYKYTFLSRPRRFGKSLFLDTLRNIFEARKELFEGLAIEDKWDWDISYPVITISFTEGKISSSKDLEDKFEEIFLFNQKKLDVTCQYKASDRRCFSELIRKVNEKYNQKVVILVDEYDKPILDNITKPEIAESIRDGLVNFYSVIKGSDEYIKFAFLTGVSKFTRTSLFSGLNNLVDISLHDNYGDICGYTQNDVETTFKPYLDGVDMSELKSWYNGYNFLGSDMYNPFDILLFISNNHKYQNYWFETGTPTFLIELIKKNNYFLPALTNLKVDEKLLSSFDINNLDFEVILYQSGYLTINKVVPKSRGGFAYNLKVPNKEVRQSLSDVIIDYMTSTNDTSKTTIQDDLYDALIDIDMVKLKGSLTSIFASIPYNNYTNNSIGTYEGFYASVVYIYLQSLGFHIIGEDVTNKGRIDLTIKMDNVIYILEFKVIDNGKLKIENKINSALQQIKDKNYAQKYHHYTLNPTNYSLYLIGIEFDSKEKNISNFQWERV